MRRLAVANGPNIFQMLLVYSVLLLTTHVNAAVWLLNLDASEVKLWAVTEL